MKLSQLLNSVAEVEVLQDVEIAALTADTRQIVPNSVFFCLEGSARDGHDFAQQALEKGAVAVVVQKDLGLLEKQILVSDTHEAYALCCANFFDNPQKKLKLVGVTGTNGKTTITHLIESMLKAAGHKTGIIGTVGTDVDGVHFPAKYTTPDPLTFYSLLEQMVIAGCEYVVMEVSSHGLQQKRVAGCQFAVGVFTNLTQDHLDYHGSMENYFKAKKTLFDLSDIAVVNLDDDYGKIICQELGKKAKSFSTKLDLADYTAKNITMSTKGSDFIFAGNSMISRVHFPVPGEFSVSNALAAMATCINLGMDLTLVTKLVSEVSGVPGRFEVLKTNTPFTVIRDYAHSPDAIEKILLALKAITTNRIVILFGCAGNRDRTKRVLMTRAAASLADFIILTSDNPRSEDPMRIIEDALPGLENTDKPYIVIADRYEAIKWGLKNCHEGDTLLLAGKGHEDYQVLANGTIHFDEREVVAELLGLEEKQL